MLFINLKRNTTMTKPKRITYIHHKNHVLAVVRDNIKYDIHTSCINNNSNIIYLIGEKNAKRKNKN